MNRISTPGMALVFTLLTLFILTPTTPAAAEGYREDGPNWWFLDVNNPNWTCTGISGKCYYTGTAGSRAYAFQGIWPVRQSRSSTFVQYVVQGGVPGLYFSDGVGVCGGALAGDSFCIFEGPNTAQGWVGSANKVLVNDTPRPDDGRLWQVNSAFYDGNFGAMYVIANRSDNDTGLNSVFMVGESFDAGRSFTWTPLLYDGVSDWVHRMSVQPDPTQPLTWAGVITYNLGGQSHLTPVRVDYSVYPPVVRVLTTSGAWTTLSVGATLTWHPFATDSGVGFGTAVVADVGGGPRLEIWKNERISTTADSDPSDGPCGVTSQDCNGGNPPLYCSNRLDPDEAGSQTTKYRLMSFSTLQFTTGWIELDSLVRALPSDYRNQSWNVFHWDVGGRNYLYFTNQDATICDQLPYWNAWTGGAMVTKLTPQ